MLCHLLLNKEQSVEACIAAFDEMVSFFEEGEVDLILLEMMSIPTRMLPLFSSALVFHVAGLVWFVCKESYAERTDYWPS